jgi:hypothetical protein
MAGRMLDAGLDLLDRQILDSNDTPVGKVDDLEFTLDDYGRAVVTSLLLGPLVLGPRLGGHLGAWVVGIGRRLRPDGDPEPARISIDDVREFGSTVKLRIPVEDTGTQALETWLRTKIVLRLPGATHEAQ